MEVKKRIVDYIFHKRPHGGRGMKYTVYKYTFHHSDLIESIDYYCCSLCSACYDSRSSLENHIKHTHWDVLKGITKEEALSMVEAKFNLFITVYHLPRSGRNIKYEYEYYSGRNIKHEDEICTIYSCACPKKKMYTKKEAMSHILAKHPLDIVGRGGFPDLKKYILKKTKQINTGKVFEVDLEKYLIHAITPRGVVYELLVDTVEEYQKITNIPLATELKKHINYSKEDLCETMTDFEDRITEVYDHHLGTPKERHPLE